MKMSGTIFVLLNIAVCCSSRNFCFHSNLVQECCNSQSCNLLRVFLLPSSCHVKFKQICKFRGSLKEFTGTMFVNDNVSFFCSKASGIKRKRIPSMQAFCGMAFWSIIQKCLTLNMTWCAVEEQRSWRNLKRCGPSMYLLSKVSVCFKLSLGNFLSTNFIFLIIVDELATSLFTDTAAIVNSTFQIAIMGLLGGKHDLSIDRE